MFKILQFCVKEDSDSAGLFEEFQRKENKYNHCSTMFGVGSRGCVLLFLIKDWESKLFLYRPPVNNVLPLKQITCCSWNCSQRPGSGETYAHLSLISLFIKYHQSLEFQIFWFGKTKFIIVEQIPSPNKEF